MEGYGKPQYNSNTTLVKVKYNKIKIEDIAPENSNTTLVKVKYLKNMDIA